MSSLTSSNFCLNFINLIFFNFSNFDIGEDAARIGLIRYNSVVDTESRILLNQFPESKADLEKEINNLPYNGEGEISSMFIKKLKNSCFSTVKYLSTVPIFFHVSSSNFKLESATKTFMFTSGFFQHLCRNV